MATLKCTRKIDENSNIRIQLEGPLDEHADFGQVLFDFTNEVIFDFDRVTHINSSGIKVWVQWHQSVQKEFPRLRFSFINCPKSVVDQINMVAGFLPQSSVVRSFKVPYFCETCDKDKVFTYVLGREYTQNPDGGFDLKVPANTCDRSDCEIEPDVVEQKYFHFLKNRYELS